MLCAEKLQALRKIGKNEVIALCCMQLTRILLILPKSKTRLLLSNLTCGCLHWNQCATPPAICQASCRTLFPPTYRCQRWHHTHTDHTHTHLKVHTHFTKTSKHRKRGTYDHKINIQILCQLSRSLEDVFLNHFSGILIQSQHISVSHVLPFSHMHTLFTNLRYSPTPPLLPE